jgi:hypothetical protein
MIFFYRRKFGRLLGLILLLTSACSSGAASLPPMLDLPGIGTATEHIDFKALPVLKGEHGLASKGETPWLFRLHSYLAFYEGKYWCMWSHGPVVEDKPTQHVRYATSADGLLWSEDKFIAPPPAGKGERYISRGFWQRDGRLIALATLDGGLPRHSTPWSSDLKLLGFEWNQEKAAWKEPIIIFPDTMSNFPPEKVANGKWLMMRRDHKRSVSVLFGGVESPSDWEVVPAVNYKLEGSNFQAEEPDWWELPDGRLMGVYRDNSNSMRLHRAISSDLGRSWSKPEKTNFPDATSKFFGVRTSRGFYILVSNANPITNASPLGRNPLCLSTSDDGITFTRMARLPIPVAPEGGPFDTGHTSGTLQYPHVLEKDGHILISYSRHKTVIETVRIDLDEIEWLRAGKLATRPMK